MFKHNFEFWSSTGASCTALTKLRTRYSWFCLVLYGFYNPCHLFQFHSSEFVVYLLHWSHSFNMTSSSVVKSNGQCFPNRCPSKVAHLLFLNNYTCYISKRLHITWRILHVLWTFWTTANSCFITPNNVNGQTFITPSFYFHILIITLLK